VAYSKGTLREHLPYIIAVVLSFIVGLLYGLSYSPHEAERVSKSVFESLSEIAKFIEIGSILAVILIFAKNALTAFISLIVGPFSPLIVAYNGWILGALYVYFSNLGKSTFFIAGTVPHGIVEIPALILSGSCGLRLGILVLRKLRYKFEGLGFELITSLKPTFKLFLISLLLFMIAAVIESFVTPIIIFITST